MAKIADSLPIPWGLVRQSGQTALMWTPDRSVQDLNRLTRCPSGTWISFATAINDSGQIVAQLASTSTYDKSVILTPVS